jgi:hypothetical protein
VSNPWEVLGIWAGAASTFGAVVVALWLSRREERRQASERERAQGERITAWLTYEANAALTAVTEEITDLGALLTVTVVVRNASEQLAYRLIATLVSFRTDEDAPRDEEVESRAFFGEVPPGTVRAEIPYEGGAMGFRAGVEIAFQDAAGRSWRRKAQGQLLPIRQDPASYYGLEEPLPW